MAGPGMKTIALSSMQHTSLRNLRLAVVAPRARLKTLRDKRLRINAAIEAIEKELRARVKETLDGIAAEHGLPMLPGDLEPELVEDGLTPDGRMQVSFFAPKALPSAPTKKKVAKKNAKKAKKKASKKKKTKKKKASKKKR